MVPSVVTVAIFLLVVNAGNTPVNAAYKTDPCPHPCRCLFFEGEWSVYCNVTGISEVPTGIPANTQLLDLASNSIHEIPPDAFAGLVNLNSLDLNSNGIADNGIKFGALALQKLTTLDLSYNSFTMIPDCLPWNITTLYFLYNKVKVLGRNSFVPYTKLQYIDLSNNGLEMIESDSLNTLSDLLTVYFPFNKLNDTSFPPNLFNKNSKLITIGLRFNRLQSFLTNLPSSVQNLDYVGNQIKTIPSYSFTSTPKLQTLAFWQGQVTTIEDNAFYGLDKLTILDFMQDTITSTLTNDTFNGLTGLQTLYMDLNNVSTIEPGAFRSFKSITSLWFSDNMLSTLDPEVLDTKYMPHLDTLFIDSNPWYCDCHLRWLREKVDNATYVIQDPHLITCAGPSNVTGKAWDVLKPSDFVCP